MLYIIGIETVTSKETPNGTQLAKQPKQQDKSKQPDSILWIIRKDVKDWINKLRETLDYKVDSNEVCRYYAPKKLGTETGSEENKTNEENEKIKFGNNFSCYIGKTGEKGEKKGKKYNTWRKIWSKRRGNNNEENINIKDKQESEQTIYSDEMLKILIEYIINHTKEGEHSTIQIWSDVGILFQQGSEKGISSPQNQLKNLKRLIEEEFGERGKCINVIIGSEQEQCKKFFDDLRQMKEGERRFGLIPENEPDLKEYLSKTPKEKLSPVPIIKYLAYHADKDKELMDLFYNTKPPAYRKNDGENHVKGSIDADYYGIVEVGLRLTDILKGISIQGGARRQRAYDKIISLILYGEDVISKKGEYEYYLQFDNSLKSNGGSKESTESPKSKKSKESIKPIKSEALYKLYTIIQDIKLSNESWINTDFGQVYAEVNRTGIEKIKKKIENRENLEKQIRNIRNVSYGTLIALTLALGWFAYNSYKDGQEKKIKDKEKNEAYKSYPDTPPFFIELPEGMTDGTKHMITMDSLSYHDRQREFLVAAYDLSKFGYTDGKGGKHNKIVDEYDNAYNFYWVFTGTDLSAQYFMTNGREILAKYGIKYQLPYAHLKEYNQYIENTLKYGDKINISNYKVEEVKIIDEKTKEEKEFNYCNEQEGKPYKLKFVELHLDNNQPIKLILASKKYQNPEGEKPTLEKGSSCAQELVKLYGENIGILPK